METFLTVVLCLMCALVMGFLVGLGTNFYLGLAVATYTFWKVEAYMESR